MPAKKQTGTTQAIERVARILSCFSESEAELGVMQISRRTGLHKSTISRLLASLHKEGFLDKDLNTGKYHLGLGLVSLAGSVLERLDLRRTAHPEIAKLVEITQETINISVLDGEECINIESAHSPKSIRYAGQLGRRTPLHCTSTGKVLLANLNAEERQKILSQPLNMFTPHTEIDPDALERALEVIREQGYAISYEEFEEGLVGIAAPIKDHTGNVMAALSVSGPTYRMGSDKLDEYISPLQIASKRISRLLGHLGDG
jgi:DNA-binding IclR family transcriptional regulator